MNLHVFLGDLHPSAGFSHFRLFQKPQNRPHFDNRHPVVAPPIAASKSDRIMYRYVKVV